MATQMKLLALLIIGQACAAPTKNKNESIKQITQSETDLKTDASTYYDRFPEYGAKSYAAYGGTNSAGGYGITGYGAIDDRYGAMGYDNMHGYDNTRGGYGGYSGYDRGYGGGGYGGAGYGGYGNAGYGASGIGGYGASGIGSYGTSGIGGYGGYGGYGGNGGINSYYGYNNPGYQGSQHLGYGYYNKRPGYGNIYSGGITPSLVTGYRGYSK